ncbi:hypothetical protein P3X46_031575 [Hevea brasiliensis]|uniref:Nuclear pore complex protein NUP1 n=1 Tax=Hevea brasiliensis TaxID=3981 RepID=A0ABQ9KLH2_HEVBR|nr:nuclear pore complex protein NUP1 [Hevea brasiliensis]KAJ9140988.1 hypothetical protein P3X46_031575 [Hevea brasiliensis]
MEKRDAETTSFAPLAAEQRGAGGKFRKQPSWRPPATPYARPPQNQEQRGRWLSKLVDPAFRLIAGGATLIFPSFFSKSQSVNALPSPSGRDDDSHTEVEQSASGDDVNFTWNNLESKATGVAGSSHVVDRSNSESEFNGHKQNQNADVSDPNGLSEIEQLMKDKRFSRDEINHLMEIIKSKAVDLPDVEQENKCLSTTVGDLRGSKVALEFSWKSAEEKQEDLNRAIGETSKIKERKYSSAISVDARKPANGLENSRSIEENHEDLDRVIWKSSTPLLQSKAQLQDDVGTSPVEIARAYMENRTSEVGFGTNSFVSKDEGTIPSSDELAVKPFIPSPVPKSSPCWPGALVQDQRGYITPQSQRGRFGLHNFPRTPYSRTIYSKTKSKLIQLQSNSDRRPNMMATPFQQAQTPFGQVNSRGNALNDGQGSVGPIRRLRHKVIAETPRGSDYFHTSFNSPQVENLSISEGLFSTPKTNLENGGKISSAKFQSVSSQPQSSEVSVPTAPAHSSLVARKILEHLERNPPTPKDKSAELRLATSWKKPLSSDLANIMPNKRNSPTQWGGFDSSEKSIQVHKSNPQESVNGVNVGINNNNSVSKMKVGTASTDGDYAGHSQDFRKLRDSQHLSAHEDVSNSKVLPNAAGSEVFSFQKKLPPQSSGTKPVLPSINIDKPNQRWTFSSDNSSGFTFPVSASSGVSSEPPTPSIMPSSSSIGLHQQNEGSSIPSYKFGSRGSTPALVFSFPSTSSVPTHDDVSDLKFNFGSDKTPRISFGSVGQGAICY